MNRTSNECVTSSDCTFINSVGVTVNRFCYEEMRGVEEVFFCDCANRYGFTGENCDQPSAQTTIFRIILLAQIITSLIAFAFTVYVFRSYLKAREALRRSETTSTKQTFYIAKCLSLIILSVFLIMLNSIANPVLLNDPTKTTVVSSRSFIEDDDERIFGPLGKFTYFSAVTSISCLLLMTSLVLLSWLRVILGVKEVFDDATIKSINRFINVTTAVYTVSAVFTFIALFSNYFTAASAMYNISVIILLVLNIYARRTFIVKVKGLGLKRKSSSAIKKIQHYSVVYITSLVFNSIILMAFFLIGVPSIKTNPPGKVEVGTIMLELFILFQNIILYYTLSYIRYLVNNLLSSATQALESN